MPNIGGLQLLPETRKKIEISIPGQNRLLILSLVLAGLLVLTYVGLKMYENSIVSSLDPIDQELQNIEKSRDKEVETQLIGLGKQFATIKPLLDAHILWSQALTKVQRITLPRVQFQSLTSSASSKKFLFKAIADNYTTVAKQIAAFYGEDSITDLQLNRVATLTDGKVEFSMELVFDPSKFLNKAK
jgi:hypothetical protein